MSGRWNLLAFRRAEAPSLAPAVMSLSEPYRSMWAQELESRDLDLLHWIIVLVYEFALQTGRPITPLELKQALEQRPS